VAVTLALPGLGAAAAPVAAAGTLLAAAAMVSRLPYAKPQLKKSGAKALAAPAAVATVVGATLASLGMSSYIPAALFGLYLASGPLVALSRRASRNR
jgi:hypothetical protein